MNINGTVADIERAILSSAGRGAIVERDSRTPGCTVVYSTAGVENRALLAMALLKCFPAGTMWRISNPVEIDRQLSESLDAIERLGRESRLWRRLFLCSVSFLFGIEAFHHLVLK